MTDYLNSKEVLNAEMDTHQQNLNQETIKTETCKKIKSDLIFSDQNEWEEVEGIMDQEPVVSNFDIEEHKSVEKENSDHSKDQDEINQEDLDDINSDESDDDSSQDESQHDDDQNSPNEQMESNLDLIDKDLPIDDDSYDEYDYENIPEFADAQTLIERYFKDHSQPKGESRGKTNNALKWNMTEIPEEGEGEDAGDKSIIPAQSSKIINDEENFDDTNQDQINNEEEKQAYEDYEESENEKSLFSNYLCTNEISDKKIVNQSLDFDSNKQNLQESQSLMMDYIQMSSAKKDKSTKLLEMSDKDKSKVIKIQSKYRQVLAKRQLKTLKQINFIKHQQVKISSSKQKVTAWKIITAFYILHREAKRLIKAWKYLQEWHKDLNEEQYYNFCNNIRELNFIERKFRKSIFKKVREYLKTIPYQWRQSYVKLIDWKIYNREVNNRLLFVQKLRTMKEINKY